MSKQAQKKHAIRTKTIDDLHIVIKQLLHLEMRLRKALEIERRRGIRERIQSLNIHSDAKKTNKDLA